MRYVLHANPPFNPSPTERDHVQADIHIPLSVRMVWRDSK